MDEIVRRLEATGIDPADTARLLSREWLVTNGLGGYASATVSGVLTRRYHGFLIAALPAPHGRVVMLNHLWERLRLADRTVAVIGGEEQVGACFREFRLESGLPVWRCQAGDVVVEKRVVMPHRQNTVHITYRLLEGDQPVRLVLRPSIHFRGHHDPVDASGAGPYALTAVGGDLYEIGLPSFVPLRLRLHGQHGAFTMDPRTMQHTYHAEALRGYASTGDLWSPGYFRLDLDRDHPATLVASTESWDMMRTLSPQDVLDAERERRRRLLLAAPPAAREGPAAELVLAADQFIVAPAGRVQDAARSQAAGDEARTVIAGYHWFTDWGRDTMISLEGLGLATGHELEAGYILRTFASYIRDGLIPNMFPEGDRDGLYHTADATLWFFQAIGRYLEATGDRETLRILLPRLVEVADHHIKGTHFGIGVDPADGLLRQGAEGYQLTWMDAKVDDWVVTPRRGKAVEINALWYNALRWLARWLREEDDELAAKSFDAQAERARASFNERFWYAAGDYLYDVVDGEHGDDPSCRPNQILAVALAHPVLEPDRWKPVVEIVRERLLTPVGLRSLAPGHPEYRATYDGDLRARDAAYHQGTVWAWLIGPFIDACLRVGVSPAAARRLLDGLVAHLGDACVGSISEVFDAEPPFTARGCVAQAWSVAEVLRCWIRTAEPAR